MHLCDRPGSPLSREILACADLATKGILQEQSAGGVKVSVVIRGEQDATLKVSGCSASHDEALNTYRHLVEYAPTLLGYIRLCATGKINTLVVDYAPSHRPVASLCAVGHSSEASCLPNILAWLSGRG